MVVELKPHQQKALKKMHNGCILYGGTGVGKTITAMTYYMEKEAPKDIYVITTAKVRDELNWQGEAVKYGVGPEGATTQGALHVDSWNNIKKYTHIHGAFFVFDEQRLVGSGAWTKAFIHIAKSNNWIMLSATPGDTWLDYIPVFVANGFYKNRTEFKRRHVVYNTFSKHPKVDRYLETGHLVRLRNMLLVHMPYERHTTRHARVCKVSYDQQLFERVVKERWHVYENRPLRDVAELFGVARKVVNSHPSRLEALTALLQRHPRVIVYYNFDYELEILRSLTSKPWEKKSESELQESKSKSSWTPTPISTDISTLSSCELCETKKIDGLNETPSLRTLAHPGTSLVPVVDGETASATADPNGLDEFLKTEEEQLRELREARRNLTSSKLGQPKTTSPNGRKLNGTSTPISLYTPETISVSTKKNELKQSSGLTVAETNNQKSGLTGVPTTKSQPISAACKSVPIAEWNGHKHEPIPKTDSWVYLVQYAAGAEGWNCISTDAMCFYSLTYSYKLFHQAHGRIDRLNTSYEDLYYYSLVSDSMIDKAVQKSLRDKRNFNEKNLGRQLGL